MRNQLFKSTYIVNFGNCIKGKALAFSIMMLIFIVSTPAWCGNIVYPWRSTTAIVKSGESFEVWFNASSGQTVNSIQLKGPFNTVSVTMSIVSGNWVYDPLSGNTYNNKITVTIPADTPAERYDIVLNTSTGDVTSYGGVKVVTKFKDEYYLMHISDGHLYQSGYDTDALLSKKSAMIDIANIIDAQIIIETGDNMYNVRNHPERETYYFLGNDALGTKGMAKASAATFLTAGDHEGLNANDWSQGTVQENSDFFNDYWGIQNHCFKYGNGRFMTLNNAWGTSVSNNGVHQYEVDEAKTWLAGNGAGGNFFLTAAHCYDKMHSFIDESKPLSLVLAGDKHNVYTSNPFAFKPGSALIAYIAASIREHFSFNLFKINNTDGTFTTPSGTSGYADVLFSGDVTSPSNWVSNLKLTYLNANNGTSTSNTATIVNDFGFPITGAKVRFVMPKGYTYSIAPGVIEQEFDGTSVHVVDVTVNLGANSTTVVYISNSGIIDLCPDDPNKTDPGLCGCGVPEGFCEIKVTGISLTPATAKLNLNIVKQMEAIITPSTATNKKIIWTSDNTSVATVSSSGLVTAVGGGTTIIKATSEDGGKFGTSTITVIPDYLNYQAEDAEFSGPVIATDQPGYNGTGFLDFTNLSNDFIKWTVYASSADTYTLSFRYALASGDRPLKLAINGEDIISSVAFPVTGSWSTWGTYTTNQKLNAGNNTIILTAIGSSGGNFDELKLSGEALGVNDLNSGLNGKTVNIYPNPLTHNNLSIDIIGFEKMNDVQVKIINIRGQTVFQKKMNNPTHLDVNTSGIMEKSVYIVSVESGQIKVFKKFIVN